MQGSLVICHCDNAAVIAQVNKLHACDPWASRHMLRCLAFLQDICDCKIKAVHVAGVNNPGADELSRNRAGTFLNKYSQVSPTPSQVPLAWVKLIDQHAPDWTSAHRRTKWYGQHAAWAFLVCFNIRGFSLRMTQASTQT